jgi:hypothetical protein
MQFLHCDFAFDLDDEWWAAAGMNGWKRPSRSYCIDVNQFPDAYEVRVVDVEPVRRKLRYGVFNDDAETGLPARDRVINILRGFVEGTSIPPVHVLKLNPGGAHIYRLTHGAHRFYLSIAAGYAHVPAILGY